MILQLTNYQRNRSEEGKQSGIVESILAERISFLYVPKREGEGHKLTFAKQHEKKRMLKKCHSHVVRTFRMRGKSEKLGSTQLVVRC